MDMEQIQSQIQLETLKGKLQPSHYQLHDD